MDAAEVIDALGLAPHPEGGHYHETWRDIPPDGGRGHGTAIYYLLRAGETARCAWAPTWRRASAPSTRCRPVPGRRRAAWGRGRW